MRRSRLLFFSRCGPEAYQTIRSIVDTDTLNTERFDTLVEMITAHYDPKPSFIVQFYNRTRAAGESIAAFFLHYTKDI